MPLITSKGQVTIPKRMREALDVRGGDSVEFVLKGGEVLIRKKERRSILAMGGIAGKEEEKRPGGR